MQAVDKITHLESWITLILGLLFLVIFLLKTIDSNLLKQHVKTFFNVPYVALETEDSIGIFNLYQMLLFLFTVVVFSLFITLVYTNFHNVTTITFSLYLVILVYVFVFFVAKWVLEYLFSILFSMKRQLKLLVASKWNYIFSMSFFIYIAIIFHTYAKIDFSYLLYFVVLLFIFRFLFILATNKKLIFSKLFYFILYLCALEIAPVVILSKLVF